MFIDVRTTYFLIGLLYVILPLTVLLLLKGHQQASVKLWCLGGLAAGSGMVVLGLRPMLLGHAPNFIVYTLGNVLMVAGYSIRIQSLQIDMRKAFSNSLLIGSVLIFILLFEYARSPLGSVGLRIEVAYIWIALVEFFLAKSAYQYEQMFGVKQARYIWLSYIALSSLLVLRAFLMMLGLEDSTPFQNSFVNNLIVIAGILTVIYSNVAYIAMILARTEKEYLVADERNKDLSEALDKKNQMIKDLMRVQAFSVLGSYGSTVVHEVLQPLTAMRFALENLKIQLSKNIVDDKVQERLQAVDSSANRAIGIIDNLRNFMIEREVQVVKVSLSEVLDEVLAMIESHANKQNVSILFKQDVIDVFVMADPHQLQRVVFNLLNNALDAIAKDPDTQLSGKIVIDVKFVQRKSFVLVKIIDSGVGLNAQSSAKIFDWLATSSTEGMGIGLALSKMLVESWHGQINAYDADPEVDGLSGAVFELKLKSAIQ